VKDLVALTTLFLLPMLCGCGTSNQTASGIPVERAWLREATRPTVTPLDREAVELAKPSWKLTTIGDSHYCAYVLSWKENPTWPKAKAVFELRQVKITVRSDSLTEADKLNGLEWRGCVELEAPVRRYYRLANCVRPHLGGGYDPAQPPDTTWSKWEHTESGCITALNLQKTNGKWEWDIPFGSHIYLSKKLTDMDLVECGRWLDETIERVDPSELPK